MVLLIALMAGSLAQTQVNPTLQNPGKAPARAGMQAAGSGATPAGDAAAGKAVWNEPQRWCKRCHGENGEGGFGPDLAGRGLSFDQVKRAIRQPWAIMPAYIDTQVTEQNIADFTAFFASLPKAAKTGAPRFVSQPGWVLGLRYATDSYGCAQCHEPEFSNPRRVLGGEAGTVNLEFFKKQIYEHTSFFPKGVMGNFSRDKLPEAVVEPIFAYVMSLGLRPLIAGQIAAPTPESPTTYSMTVTNQGKKAEGGLTAEDVTIVFALAPGTTVTTTSGAGYQGVKRDQRSNLDTAVFTLPKLAPEDKVTVSVTLGGEGAARGVQPGSAVRWAKPDAGRQRPGYPQLPEGEYRDARIQDGPGDFVNVNPPRPAGPGRGGAPAGPPAAGRGGQ